MMFLIVSAVPIRLDSCLNYNNENFNNPCVRIISFIMRRVIERLNIRIVKPYYDAG